MQGIVLNLAEMGGQGALSFPETELCSKDL